MNRHYYPISEEMAMAAHDMMSFFEYKEGSRTAEYRKEVDDCYNIAEKVAEARPDEAYRVERLADRFAKRLAENFNRNSEIGTRCPSVMIAGPGNFPTGKKQKQAAAWDSNMRDYEDIMGIKSKLISIYNGKDIIKSDDERAIEKLEAKLESRKELQETMKAVNAYYRKNKTVIGCPDITTEQAEEIQKGIEEDDWHTEKKPFYAFSLSNNNAEIHRIEERLKKLKEAKEQGDKEEEGGFYRYIENTNIMRVQFEFNGKPEEAVRDILKANGFRWAPSAGKWQRQLTENGKRAAQKCIEAFKAL